MPVKNYLSTNVASLLAYTGWSKEYLAKRSGVSLRMIAYILSKERAASIEIAEAIGNAFGISVWAILNPHLEPGQQGKLEKLVKNYSNTSPKGRDYIDMVADREGGLPKIISKK